MANNYPVEYEYEFYSYSESESSTGVSDYDHSEYDRWQSDYGSENSASDSPPSEAYMDEETWRLHNLIRMGNIPYGTRIDLPVPTLETPPKRNRYLGDRKLRSKDKKRANSRKQRARRKKKRHEALISKAQQRLIKSLSSTIVKRNQKGSKSRPSTPRLSSAADEYFNSITRPKSARKASTKNTSKSKKKKRRKRKARRARAKTKLNAIDSVISRLYETEVEKIKQKKKREMKRRRRRENISAALSDCINCVFKPKISPLAQSLELGDFLERQEHDIEMKRIAMKKQEKERKKRPKFKPSILDDGVVEEWGEFIERMERDAVHRRANLKNRQKKALEKFTFAPSGAQFLSQNREEINANFLHRLALDNEQRKKRKKLFRKKALKNCPFKPKLSTKAQKIPAGNFTARLLQDAEERKRKKEEDAERALYSFKPKLKHSASRAKAMSKIKRSFLERYSEDIAHRHVRLAHKNKLATEHELEGCTFSPKISKTASKLKLGRDVVSRMEYDIHERQEKQKERDKRMGIKR